MNQTQNHKSGYVALIGRPNAGKSTLLNRILETKLVAVTPRPQTTRNRIFGIYDREHSQIIFQDTPGLLEADDAMHEFMMREAERALEDADLSVWLVDSIKGVTAREQVIAKKVLENYSAPLLVVFNKIDKVTPEKLTGLQDELQGIFLESTANILYISALLGDGVDELLEEIHKYLPTGPKFYPSEQLSDRTTRFFVEELIREQAFYHLRDEIPYSLAVKVESMKEQENGVTAIQAVLHVERDSQKGILVGKKGSMIKTIGTAARQEIEEFLHTKVYLELFVKVSKKWRKRKERLEEFGYTEEK